MKLWRALVLANLALVTGLLLGYLLWGREVVVLERELALGRNSAIPLGVARTFAGEGVVRALLPEIQVVVLTHGEIQGFMPSMTMGFRVADPAVLSGLEVGDVVRFTLGGVPPNVVLTEVVKQGKS